MIRTKQPKKKSREIKFYRFQKVYAGSFENASQAAKHLKIEESCIRRCLNGSRKTAGGYFFEREK